jgi:uncharacterized membrane protein
MDSDPNVLEVAVILFGVVISIMMIVAILQIPKIAKYQKATMALTAYMAKRQGVDENLVRELVKNAGEQIMFHLDEAPVSENIRFRDYKPEKAANPEQQKLQSRYDRGEITFEQFQTEWNKLG